MVLNGLKPERVFYYFEELTKIPRCSKKEQAVSNYLYKALTQYFRLPELRA